MTKDHNTEQAVSDLPPLPEPFDRLVGHPSEGAPVFTASQMREYALAALSQVLGKAQEPECPNCKGTGHRWEANGEKIPCDLCDPRDAIADLVEGMSVSIDVSTGDYDSGNRLFGIVNEAMHDTNGKHGLTLLVYETTPNFKAAPQVAQEEGERVIPAGAAISADGTTYYNVEKTYAEAEEAECVRMWLDEQGAPVGDDGGKFSLVGRIRSLFPNLPDFADAQRFRWLCEDHADEHARRVRDDILSRMPVMSKSAACRAVDYAMIGEYHLPSEAAPQPDAQQSEKDAERYRWLRERPIRSNDNYGGAIDFTFAIARPEPNQWCVDSVRGEQMDAAIDAALAKEQGR